MPPKKANDLEDDEGPRRMVWMKTDDDDLWTLTYVEKVWQGQAHLMRQHAPKQVSKKLIVDEKQLDNPKLFRPATQGDVEEAASTDDLCALADPQEWSMLHCLRERYEEDVIFTAVGAVLLAINPYKRVASCHPSALAELAAMDPEALPAHIFAIAHAAYSGLTDDALRMPQSILVSGESGAGKTETTKLLVACLALCSRSSGHVVDAALESGLLLEAFGNARTVYNNNSSRFGKWCAVYFDGRGKMQSCALTAFLLEQSRIVKPNEGERNYHIFYHLLAGASEADRSEWQLLAGPGAYTYTKGEATSPGIDDAALWGETIDRMRILGFASTEMRHELLRHVASVLALGNVAFELAPDAGTQEVYVPQAASLTRAAALLRVPEAPLAKCLTTRTVVVQGDKLDVPLDLAGCADARDAVAKAVFNALFSHLLVRINVTLEESAQGEPADPASCVGLLDIFGFENFRLNGFEQLCINFTNERLQKFFMDTLIRRERTEYEREGIELIDVSYPDNSAKVEFLDHAKQGPFVFLDEECRAPNPTDEKFVSRMHSTFSGAKYTPVYSKPKFGAQAVGADLGPEMAKLQFVVKHYAEDVQYTAINWLEKNRGKLQEAQARVLAMTESVLLAEITPDPEESSSNKGPTVSGAFRASLKQLAATMVATHQHFIRCIKPNQDKVAGRLEGVNVIRQMRYLGVPSVVEINRVGYPIKLLFEDFKRKYRCLSFDEPELIADSVPLSQQCLHLLAKGGMPAAGPDGWETTRLVQIGKSKVFLKPEVVHCLDIPRRAARAKAATAVQAYARRRVAVRVTHFVRAHLELAMAVRAVLDRREPNHRIATIEDRVVDAGPRLDELKAATKLPPRLALAVQRAHDRNDELERELRSLAQGLQAEVDAIRVLDETLARTTATPRETFLHLKEVVDKAAEASQDVTDELRERVQTLEKVVHERFKDMLSEWEAEVDERKRLREERRRAKCRSIAAELAERIASGGDAAPPPVKGNARAGSGGVGAAAAGGATPRPTDYDHRDREFGASRRVEAEAQQAGLSGPTQCGSQFALQAKESMMIAVAEGAVSGLSLSVGIEALPPPPADGSSPGRRGIVFSDVNEVTHVPPECLLHVGDFVLSVDGAELDGRRAAEVMLESAPAGSKWRLAIARPQHQGAGDEAETLPEGEYSSWVTLQRGKMVFVGGLTATTPAHKAWAVLSGGALTLYEERVRGEPLVKESFKLAGCVCQAVEDKRKNRGSATRASAASTAADAPESVEPGGGPVSGGKRSGGKKGGGKKGNGKHRGSLHDMDEDVTTFAEPVPARRGSAAGAAKGGQRRGSLEGEKGKMLEALFDKGLLPIRLAWPNKEGYNVVVVLSVVDAAERSGWAKAIKAAIKTADALLPTTGALLEKPMGGGGCCGLLAPSWSRLWFELQQANPETGAPVSFVSYNLKGEQQKPPEGAKPSGVIQLGAGTVLGTTETLDPKITTRQPHAFSLTTSPLDGGAGGAVVTTLAAENSTSYNAWVGGLERAISSFATGKGGAGGDAEERKTLSKKSVQQLRMMLEYMGALPDASLVDKNLLVAEILRQRKLMEVRQRTKARRTTAAAVLSKEHERLMHRDVEELRDLLEYLDVPLDTSVTLPKEKLVHMVIEQKHMENAAAVAQRIMRKRLRMRAAFRSALVAQQMKVVIERT